jgi:hypothetical protein
MSSKADQDSVVASENLTMFDYKDKSSIISKLLDTNELFMEINI